MRKEAFIAQATPDVLLQSLKVCIMAKRPVFTWGNPGIGKSDIHRQLAEDLGRPLEDLRASQWDAVDTRGVPFLYDIEGEGPQKITEDSLAVVNKAVKATGWAIPDVFPRDPNSNAIIFLDELNSAAPSVQAALYQFNTRPPTGRLRGAGKCCDRRSRQSGNRPRGHASHVERTGGSVFPHPDADRQ